MRLLLISPPSLTLVFWTAITCWCYFPFYGFLGDQLSHNVLDWSSFFTKFSGYVYGWAWSIRPCFHNRSMDNGSFHSWIDVCVAGKTVWTPWIQPRVAPLVTVKSSLSVGRCAFAVAFAMVIANRFWRKSAKIGVPHLHAVPWHSTADRKIATWIRAITPPVTPLRLIDKNMVNFHPVTHEFCRRVCAGRATRWALPCISGVSLSSSLGP